MAKSPCTDCIEKYEKTKQRKRQAKRKEKMNKSPTGVIGVNPYGAIKPPVIVPSPYSQLRSPPNQNLSDLLSMLRLNETMKQQQNTQQLDSLERTPKPIPAPKSANEALSQVADNYLFGLGIARDVPKKIYGELNESVQSMNETLKPANEKLYKFLESVGRVMEVTAEPDKPLPIDSRVTKKQFIATAPPANLIDDLQRGGGKWETKLPEPTGPVPIKIVGPIESAYADVLGGQQTLLDLMLKKPGANPFANASTSTGTIESEDVFEDASGEPESEPLLTQPETVRTAETLVTGQETQIPTSSAEQLVAPRRRGRPSKADVKKRAELEGRLDYIRGLIADGYTEEEAIAIADETEGSLYPDVEEYRRLRGASADVTEEDIAQLD